MLPKKQFGFQRGRETVLQVARIVYDIKENFQKNTNIAGSGKFFLHTRQESNTFYHPIHIVTSVLT